MGRNIYHCPTANLYGQSKTWYEIWCNSKLIPTSPKPTLPSSRIKDKINPSLQKSLQLSPTDADVGGAPSANLRQNQSIQSKEKNQRKERLMSNPQISKWWLESLYNVKTHLYFEHCILWILYKQNSSFIECWLKGAERNLMVDCAVWRAIFFKILSQDKRCQQRGDNPLKQQI